MFKKLKALKLVYIYILFEYINTFKDAIFVVVFIVEYTLFIKTKK